MRNKDKGRFSVFDAFSIQQDKEPSLVLCPKTALPSRDEPGKYNAPDHRFVAGDRECFYCIALKTISDCSRIFRLVALSKAVDLGLIWTIRALGLI